jgi:hypothetical protein
MLSCRHNCEAFVQSLQQWGSQILYKGSVYCVPPGLWWNPVLLQKGFLILDTPQSLVCFWYWAATTTYIESCSILKRAIEHGVRFSLAILQTNIPLFRPATISEYDKGVGKVPHKPGYIETPLSYGRGGIALRQQYIMRAGAMVAHPNAGAFIAMGGPTSWIAH